MFPRNQLLLMTLRTGGVGAKLKWWSSNCAVNVRKATLSNEDSANILAIVGQERCPCQGPPRP